MRPPELDGMASMGKALFIAFAVSIAVLLLAAMVTLLDRPPLGEGY